MTTAPIVWAWLMLANVDTGEVWPVSPAVKAEVCHELATNVIVRDEYLTSPAMRFYCQYEEHHEYHTHCSKEPDSER